MSYYDELEKINNYQVEILTFKAKGDVVLTIDSKDTKMVLSGKAATNLIELVDDYLNKLYQNNKEPK